MTDSKKRLEEILKEFYTHIAGVDDYGCKDCRKIAEKILKEFVYKDNLPSEDEYAKSLYNYLKHTKIKYLLNGWVDCIPLAEIIRKLIEGKK